MDKSVEFEKIEGRKACRIEPPRGRAHVAQHRGLALDPAARVCQRKRLDLALGAEPHHLAKAGDENRGPRHQHPPSPGDNDAILYRHDGDRLPQVRPGHRAANLCLAMPDLFPLIRPILRRLPAETARDLTVCALAAGLGRFCAGRQEADPPILAQRLWGLDFPNPVGLAAGYDKDGHVPDALLRLGFGFVELGTVTPRPQSGNPKPRVFRLDEEQAVVNRMGFNSGGLDLVASRLSRRARSGVVGLNLGKNRDSADASADYEEGIRRGARLADYLVINVSSPNTPHLRDLQARTALESLLRRLHRGPRRDRHPGPAPAQDRPRPDGRRARRHRRGDARRRDRRPDRLQYDRRASGRPQEPACQRGGRAQRAAVVHAVDRIARRNAWADPGRLPLIGAGGIGSAADAYEKIRAGASLVQLYTALVFAGPALVARIKQGLAKLLLRDGFASVAEAVGTADHPPLPALQVSPVR